MADSNYGILLNDSIKIHRSYFRQMVKLLGIQVVYKAPKKDKDYTNYTEIIDKQYEDPIVIGCIFDEHPNQQTLKKMGWISELQENASIIHVDYDLQGLQQGALFIIPSGLDNTKGRLFRVTKMSNTMVYPCSIACEIVPEYENTFSTDQYNYKHTDFNVLDEDKERINTDATAGLKLLNEED